MSIPKPKMNRSNQQEPTLYEMLAPLISNKLLATRFPPEMGLLRKLLKIFVAPHEVLGIFYLGKIRPYLFSRTEIELPL